MSAEPQTELATGTVLKVVLGEPATYDISGFEALTYSEIVDVVNIGAGGGTAQIQSYIPLKTGVAVKRTGGIEYSVRTVQMGNHSANSTGQILLKSLFDGANKGKVCSVGIFYVDGAVDYFIATVSSFSEDQLDANTFKMVSATFAPTDKTIKVAGTSTYTVTFTAGAHGHIVGDAVQIVESGEDASTVYANADSGYEFSTWSDANTSNPRTITNVTADKNLTATFVTA